MSSTNVNKKRQHSSTASELDISANSDNHPVYPVFKQKKKKNKQSKQISENKHTPVSEISSEMENKSKKESSVDPTQDTSYEGKFEKRLTEISEKLSSLLSKDDTTFFKTIIEEKMNEMKESFLSQMSLRIAVLGGDVHEQAKTIENLEGEIKEKDKLIEELKAKDKTLFERIKKNELYCEKFENDSEQYSRRNNVRIYGIAGDEKNQSSETVVQKVIETIKEKTGLVLQKTDIDITHRLGVYKVDKHRPIIVKFVRRQTKIDLFKVSKKLKDHNIFVNEDLTKLNADVLASCRVKDKSRVEKAWSFEGKIYVKYHKETSATQIPFKQYHIWLNLPWPEKEAIPAQALCQPTVVPPTSHVQNPVAQTKYQTPAPAGQSMVVTTPTSVPQTLSQTPGQPPNSVVQSLSQASPQSPKQVLTWADAAAKK